VQPQGKAITVRSGQPTMRHRPLLGGVPTTMQPLVRRSELPPNNGGRMICARANSAHMTHAL
jgi:hypothetical protein